MAYLIMGFLFFAMLFVLKILKGVIKLVLILILLGLLIATFAGKDQIESVPVNVPTATS